MSKKITTHDQNPIGTGTIIVSLQLNIPSPQHNVYFLKNDYNDLLLSLRISVHTLCQLFILLVYQTVSLLTRNGVRGGFESLTSTSHYTTYGNVPYDWSGYNVPRRDRLSKSSHLLPGAESDFLLVFYFVLFKKPHWRERDDIIRINELLSERWQHEFCFLLHSSRVSRFCRSVAESIYGIYSIKSS